MRLESRRVERDLTRATSEVQPQVLSRNAYLRLDDAALLRDCHQERYRASRPGG
jgi:hypothetical protein